MIVKHTLIACAMLMPHLVSATSSNTQKTLATFYTVEGNIQQAYNNLVNKKLGSIGFQLSNQDKSIKVPYPIKVDHTMLDVLRFTPIVRDSTILPLLNIDPRIAGFSPFNMLLYEKRDENMSYVGHLTTTIMLDILNIKNDKVRRKFSAPFKALDATIAQALGGEIFTKDYTKLPEQTMINYEYTFETPEDVNNFVTTFQDKFKSTFKNAGYLISGYHNFMESTPNAKKVLSNYHAFWTYSLDNLKLNSPIVDIPEVGIFAPSTIYMYIKKDTNKLVLGMARLHNWSEVLNHTDHKHIKLINQLDTEIAQILEKMGMHSVENIQPLPSKSNPETSSTQKTEIANNTETTTQLDVNKSKDTHPAAAQVQHIKVLDKVVEIAIPSVPKVISLAFGKESISTNRRITFSKRVPPNYVPHRFDKAQKSQSKDTTNTKIGEVNKGKIAAYLRGDFMDVASIKKHLENAGFTILATAALNKKEDLISIVFTNDTLRNLSSKPNRGFMASLRLLVDTKEKRISITNPLYLAKGFLQDDFDEKTAKEVLAKLTEAFPKLSNSKDSLKYQLLSKYQFMNGMPKYQDMIEVASGDTLLDKIKNNKKVIFTQTLSNGATLIGIELGKRTRKFTKRIGRNNAAMLPYPILIEDGKAKILDPKFYISYMYPMLTMSEFMTIATVPDAMVKDCEKVFK